MKTFKWNFFCQFFKMKMAVLCSLVVAASVRASFGFAMETPVRYHCQIFDIKFLMAMRNFVWRSTLISCLIYYSQRLKYFCHWQTWTANKTACNACGYNCHPDCSSCGLCNTKPGSCEIFRLICAILECEIRYVVCKIFFKTNQRTTSGVTPSKHVWVHATPARTRCGVEEETSLLLHQHRQVHPGYQFSRLKFVSIECSKSIRHSGLRNIKPCYRKFPL